MQLRLSIKNFRSISSTELCLKSGVSVLIGPNGAGKTSLFLALKFLRDVIVRGAGLAVARAGGPRSTFRRGESEIRFSIFLDLSDRIYRRRKCPFRLTWEIRISKPAREETAIISSERLRIEAIRGEKRIPVFEAEINRTNLTRIKHKVTLAPTSDVGKDLFSRISEFGSNRRKADALKNIKREILESLKRTKKSLDRSFLQLIFWYDGDIRSLYTAFVNLNEYNILPDIARQSTDQLPFAEMLPNGRNLSEVIYSLEKKAYHRIAESKMYDDDALYASPYFRYGKYPMFYLRRSYLRHGPSEIPLRNALPNINKELSAAVNSIQSVSAQIDQTNGRRFVVFRAGRHTFYPDEVSDGTIKWLCVLVSLYVPFSRIYLLEEPENFLHPWMQQKLIRIMREQASANKTVFLLTTHSATILNAVNPDEVVLVRLTEAGTVASTIEDRDEIESALKAANFGLGDLWVSGAIGAVPGENG